MAAQAEVPAEDPPPEATNQPSLDDLYDTGRVLFDLLAPPEIKDEYEFPPRERWSEFAAELQRALDEDSLEDLAAYEPEARAALVALRTLPGGDEYADWLEERLDYIVAARAVQTEPPPPVAPAPAAIPHLDLWRGRMASRPVPSRAEALLPGLRAAFAEEGVPEALAWLAEVESSFNPAARSPVGARGLFQFMPGTAQDMGLSTSLPDERTDPEKSARAAAKYLRQLHARFGDWALALAAYNAGPGRVRRTLDKHGATSYAAIAQVLPAETQMYVPKVLATVEARTGTAWAELVAPGPGA
jgi:membrane-bound lytic murein transglycosylase D